jgi:mono/diheme cytochrome c family protein
MYRVASSLIVGFGIVMVTMTGLSAQNPGGSAEGNALKNPVASGQAAYAKNCRFCHGPEAKGNGPMAPRDTHPSDLTDAKWDRGATDGEIFMVIRDGAGPEMKMKGYKGRLTDNEMWSIVNYLRSVGPKKK